MHLSGLRSKFYSWWSPSLLKNLAPQTGDALSVRAMTSTGRDAIGARITLTSGGRKQMDEVRSGGSFISQNDFRLHFGLGAEPQRTWPFAGSTAKRRAFQP